MARGELRLISPAYRANADHGWVGAHLLAKVQRGLGKQAEQAGNAELERRIHELGDELTQLNAAFTQTRTERDELRAKLNEAEDTVTALRQSSKQMMRDQSL